MNKDNLYKVLFLATLSVIICSGCRTPGDDYDTGSDYIRIDGDQPLGERGARYGDPVTEDEFQSEAVLFDYDSNRVGDSQVAKVERVAVFMKRNRRVKIYIEGHCDEKGSREYNLSLGERRAISIRDYLIGLNIANNRVSTKSYGEEDPIDPGHNSDAWRMNRRGELVLYR